MTGSAARYSDEGVMLRQKLQCPVAIGPSGSAGSTYYGGRLRHCGGGRRIAALRNGARF